YECLAGRPPFQGEDPISVLMKHVQEDPPPISQFTDGVPEDLELICRKCLAKEPDARYQTAAALAQDLGRFQRGDAVSVGPAGRLERLGKWAKRKPAVVAAYALSGVAGVLALVVFLGLRLLWEAQAARDVAERARADAESARDQLAVEKTVTEAARDDA